MKLQKLCNALDQWVPTICTDHVLTLRIKETTQPLCFQCWNIHTCEKEQLHSAMTGAGTSVRRCPMQLARLCVGHYAPHGPAVMRKAQALRALLEHMPGSTFTN